MQRDLGLSRKVISQRLDTLVKHDVLERRPYQMVDHVLTTPVGRSAWFKDPDSNTIALFQPA
jgi:DNA-binding HxlR family transcriptional regulator